MQRLLSDTGFLARELLGYNYDEDEGGRKLNVGLGGIVESGKTEEAVRLLDDTSLHNKMLVMPRESRKSTLLIAWCVRLILFSPDIRIFYVTRTDALALEKAIAVRDQLQRHEITALFGPQQGERWGTTEFTVATRTMHGLQNATFTAFSQESMRPGGRCNLLLVDDFIDHTNVTNQDQNRKSKELFASLLPLVAKGGSIGYVATIWDDNDLTNDLQNNRLFRPPLGGQIVCGAGVRIVTTQDGSIDLEPLPTGLTFPHLTLDHLRQKLWGMTMEGKYDHFCRQYLNQTTVTGQGSFQRKFFKPLLWGDDLKQLSTYLLTDTATGQTVGSCYSVLAYVGLDAQDNVYLLDLDVGHWDETEFCDRFFAMLEEWQTKCNHCGEAWEGVALATVFRHQIERDSRARKLRLRTIEMARPPQSQKDARIQRMQPVLKQGHFYVVATVPKTFVDLDGPKSLWDPVGHYDATTKAMLPSGELVDEFVKGTGKRDIADTLAMILESEKTRKGGSRRLCVYKPYRPRESPKSLTQERTEQYRADHYESANSADWWERTLHEQGL